MGSCLSSFDNVEYSEASGTINNCATDEASLIFNGNMRLSSKVTISIECSDLLRLDISSKSDPFVTVFMQDQLKNWYEIGRTEVLANTQQPKFVKKIITNYKFEEIQKVRFEVYDADTSGNADNLDLSDQDFVGFAECELPTLVHALTPKSFHILRNNEKSGNILIKCEELPQSSDVDEKNGITPVYKTEVSEKEWKKVSIDVAILCGCDFNRPLVFKAFQYKRSGNHILIGSYETQVAAMFQMGGQTIPLSDSASLTIRECYFEEKASFLQFVQNGLDINFMTAIDFTGSNGNPSLMDSLHYCNPSLFDQGKMNQYEQAIAMIGNVIEFYDTDRNFPVYGFGACPPNSSMANHCFALTMNESNPEVAGVRGIMDIYHSVMPTLHFSGPTFFAPVLSKAATIASIIQQERSKYLILLIITDGEIHDMDATIKMLVDCSDLPLSVLIVGVGDADFTNMHRLDGDNRGLGYNGKYAKRDIVQFVAVRELAMQHPEMIAQQLLAEVPGQVTSYMKARGITPSTLHWDVYCKQPICSI